MKIPESSGRANSLKSKVIFEQNLETENQTESFEKKSSELPAAQSEDKDGMDSKSGKYCPVLSGSFGGFQREASRESETSVEQCGFQENLSSVSSVENVCESQEATFFNCGQFLKRKRPIIIDGQNVATEHGWEVSIYDKSFSAKGLQIVVDYFRTRGHEIIRIWLPRTRPWYSDYPSNRGIMDKLFNEGHIKWSMVRTLSSGEIILDYDDRCIVEDAAHCGGVIISRDQFRDLLHVSNEIRKVIEERTLHFNFCGDNFMPSFQPLGRYGPNLDEYLNF